MAKKLPQEQEPSARDKLLNAYRICFATPEGQVVLDDLKRTYQDKSSVVGVDSALIFDVNRTMVLEGCRLVYLRIVQMVEEGMGKNGGDTDSNNDRDETSIWDA